jgi:hypothetical protein
MDINVSQGRVTMKTTDSNQRRMAFIAILALVSLLALFPARAQTTQDGASFSDTAKYMTTFLANHGCTNWTTNWSFVKYCSTIVNADGCVIELKKTRTTARQSNGMESTPNSPSYKVDLRDLDPTSLKMGPALHEQYTDGTNADVGLGVIAQSQTGGDGLSLPVDNADNAAHLINALSHAITLCGGKKAAF